MRKKSKNVIFTTIGSMLLLMLIGCKREAVQTLPQREWELMWSDEFNGTAGTAPDNTKWEFDIGTGTNGWGNAELQYYTNRSSNIKLDGNGKLLSGDAPSKEAFLHLGMYQERANSAAVVHLHCLHAVAVSCLDGLNADDVFPPITAYAVMQVGKLALVPYFAPGDTALAEAVRKLAGKHHAVLLANHGPVVAGTSLSSAVYAIEELEQTARLMLLLQSHSVRLLTVEQIAELNRRFPG